MKDVDRLIEAKKNERKIFKRLFKLNTLKKYNINPERLIVLNELYKLEYDTICVNDLSEQTGLLPPTLSRMIPTLEGQNLVKCIPSKIDKRTKMLRITYRGLKCVESAIKEQKKAS